MGLGAYLAAATEDKHYRVEEAREWEEVEKFPLMEEAEIYDLMLEEYGLGRECVKPLLEELMKNKEMWVKVRLLLSRLWMNLDADET